MSKLSFHDCCRAIFQARSERAVNWAVNYAAFGLKLPEDSDDAQMQALYILNNIKTWHGDVAQQVRQSLKEFTK